MIPFKVEVKKVTFGEQWNLDHPSLPISEVLDEIDMRESLAGICRFISYDEVSHWLIQGVTPRQIHMIAHMTNEITENSHA
jgi:hypothetical protein